MPDNSFSEHTKTSRSTMDLHISISNYACHSLSSTQTHYVWRKPCTTSSTDLYTWQFLSKPHQYLTFDAVLYLSKHSSCRLTYLFKSHNHFTSDAGHVALHERISVTDHNPSIDYISDFSSRPCCHLLTATHSHWSISLEGHRIKKCRARKQCNRLDESFELLYLLS